ncbi:MAG: hypothetical protein K2L40_01955 [Lactobacillus sp.]|nr:hypothetical protein [Lactobacillus sp.]
MNNDAVLTKALNEIARLELLNFRKDVVIEELQNEIRMRDQLKGGEQNAPSRDTKHEQADNQSKSRGGKR